MTIYNFSLLNIPFANGAPSNEISPFPDFDRGLGIAFDETDGKPEMKGLNGLFQQITMAAIYLKQRGIPEWDSNLEYPASAFVTKGGRLYKSKTQNTGKTPENSQADWDVWASVSDITVSTNGNLKKTANTNGSIHLEVPTADSIQRGSMRFATASEVVNKSNVSAAINPRNAKDIIDSSFSFTKSATGSRTSPDGFIMKWGTQYVPSDGNSDVVFQYPFTNSCLNAQATLPANFNVRDDAGCGVSWSRTGLTLRNGSVDGLTLSWFAIGY